MIQAEIRNKVRFPGIEESELRVIERMEDLLTSNVFGVLKNLSADSWEPLLPECLLEDIRHGWYSVEFWPRYSGGSAIASLSAPVQNTEPDLVLQTDRSLTLVDVKDLSSFGRSVGVAEHQLLPERKLGTALAKARGKQFHLIAVVPFSTSVEPEVLSLFPDDVVGTRVHVRFWEDVYQGLRTAAFGLQGSVEGRFLRDFVEYLRVKGIDAEKLTGDRQRSLAYYFGDPDASSFLSALREVSGYFDEDAEMLTIPVAWLPTEGRSNLADAFGVLYRSEVVSRSPLTNTIDGQKSILPVFLLEAEEKAVSDSFYRVLSEAYYHLPHLRLNGRHDFSVKARIRTRGNQEISLFTVRSTELAVTIQLFR